MSLQWSSTSFLENASGTGTSPHAPTAISALASGVKSWPSSDPDGGAGGGGGGAGFGSGSFAATGSAEPSVAVFCAALPFVGGGAGIVEGPLDAVPAPPVAG